MGSSGFDMAGTIAWYKKNHKQLQGCLPFPKNSTAMLSHRNLRLELLTPHMKKLADALVEKFPKPAQNRSIYAGLEFSPAAWFKRGSTAERAKLTHEPTEALSPTSIIPSMVGYSDDNRQAQIVLFAINEKIAPRHIATLIHAQGFVHEYAHTVLYPDLWVERMQLRLSDNSIVEGDTYLSQVLDILYGHAPISHYASSFLKPDGTLKGEEPVDEVRVLSEVLAELIAAYLLGFAYQPAGNGLEPFKVFGPDEPEMLDFIKTYLHATRV